MPKTRKKPWWSGWRGKSPNKKQRRATRKRCGKKCFLGPNLSFPVCAKGTCRINKRGVMSAYIRAKQWGKPRSFYKNHWGKPRMKRKVYTRVAKKARKLMGRKKGGRRRRRSRKQRGGGHCAVCGEPKQQPLLCGHCMCPACVRASQRKHGPRGRCVRCHGTVARLGAPATLPPLPRPRAGRPHAANGLRQQSAEHQVAADQAVPARRAIPTPGFRPLQESADLGTDEVLSDMSFSGGARRRRRGSPGGRKRRKTRKKKGGAQHGTKEDVIDKIILSIKSVNKKVTKNYVQKNMKDFLDDAPLAYFSNPTEMSETDKLDAEQQRIEDEREFIFDIRDNFGLDDNSFMWVFQTPQKIKYINAGLEVINLYFQNNPPIGWFESSFGTNNQLNAETHFINSLQNLPIKKPNMREFGGAGAGTVHVVPYRTQPSPVPDRIPSPPPPHTKAEGGVWNTN